MQLTHDIWHEVLKCFEDEDQLKKRATLLNLAVVSRTLSGLALAALWRKLDSLQPIVNVINSLALPQEGPFLTQVPEENRNWMLLRRPSGDRINLRVKYYLNLVRVLQLLYKDEQERPLWNILLTMFWGDEPLLSGLRELYIDFVDSHSFSYQCLAHMLPLRVGVISASGEQNPRASTAFYELLLARGCSLHELRFTSDLCPPPTLPSFKNLKKLVLQGPRRIGHRSIFSLLELLRQQPALNYLSVHMETVATPDTIPTDPFTHLSLEVIVLQGPFVELRSFLSSNITCPSMRSFTLDFGSTAETSWGFLCSRAALMFPNLRELDFAPYSIDYTPELVPSDLAKLLYLPMESLNFLGVPYRLSVPDLRHMLDAWPKLHTLSLPNSRTPFDGYQLFSTFAYPNLRNLNLPINFTTLGSLIPGISTVRNNSLSSIVSPFLTRLPVTFEGRVMLAQNLLMVFPRLKNLVVRGCSRAEAAGLWTIIKSMRVLVAAHNGTT